MNAERLDRDTMDQIIEEIRQDGVFTTSEELNSIIQGLIKSLKNGTLQTPNRSGGANGAEVIAKIDATIGVDWKSGTASEILATIEAAGDVTMTGVATGTNLAASAAAPATQTAGIALFGQKDSSVGAKATFDFETEEAAIAVGTFTPSHKIAIWINGVEYNWQLDAV